MTEGLFAAPEPEDRKLSRFWSGLGYKSGGPKPKWTKSSTNLPCDECFGEQHENRGSGWPRNLGRDKRTMGTRALYLCGVHAQLWRQKDQEDGA